MTQSNKDWLDEIFNIKAGEEWSVEKAKQAIRSHIEAREATIYKNCTELLKKGLQVVERTGKATQQELDELNEAIAHLSTNKEGEEDANMS